DDRLTEAGDRPALDERLVAEQDERRRLAELIHDGPVQYLAAVAQMLDAALAGVGSIDEEDGTRPIGRGAPGRAPGARRGLRELVTGVEPDALRDEGFAPAVQLLVERVAGRRGIAAEVEIAEDALLGENASVGLYQIVRESLDQAIRRGPPTNVAIRLTAT